MRILALLLIAASLVGAAPPFAPPSAGARTIYRHAALIDGTGQPLRRDMAVITAGERILAVVADAALTQAQVEGAREVDLRGKFLLPGLIDSHQHLATPPERAQAELRLRRDIYSGITATRDMADDLRQIADITRAARIGEIASPDIDYAALMAGPTFFLDPRTKAIAAGAVPGKVPWEQAIDSKADLSLAVARARGTSATAIKIYANLDASAVAAITKEAHRQGMRVWAHAMVFPATPSQVVQAGVDTVSHTCYLAYEAMRQRPDSYQGRFPVDASVSASRDRAIAELFADMKRLGTILDATLHVYRSVEAAALKEGKPPLCTVAFAGRLTNEAYRAGVSISAGTDGDTDFPDRYPALFDELELLHDAASLPLSAVVEAATMNGARAMGEASEMGSIEPGKLANMVVLERNPLEDVRNFRSVVLTVKRGRRFPRSEFER